MRAFVWVCAGLVALGPGPAGAEQRIGVVGSATVLPLVHSLAEQFASHFGYLAPALEVTGAGGGFRQFCAGLGFEHPDVVATARRMTADEQAACARTGVSAITEIPIGHEGVVLAQDAALPPLGLTREQLFRALARELPGQGGLERNPNRTWRDLDPALPDRPIEVLSAPAGSPMQDAFVAFGVRQGCQALPHLADLLQERPGLCETLRDDAAHEYAGKTEAAVTAWLDQHPQGLAVLPYASLRRHAGLRAVTIDGVEPSEETVASGRYPLARTVYLYVKNAHVGPVPGLQQLLYEATAERTIGPEGYLVEHGLLPLDDRGRNHARDMALSLAPMGP